MSEFHICNTSDAHCISLSRGDISEMKELYLLERPRGDISREDACRRALMFDLDSQGSSSCTSI